MNERRPDSRPLKSRFNESLSICEMDVTGKKKDYPSINDYYKAAARGDQPIQYQHGLSNYSSVQLGDDRISFKKSLSQDMYKLDPDRASKLAVALNNYGVPEKAQKQRKESYAQANSLVGLHKIHEMEQMMRDKLQQRTKTGPFQLRKTFKYFDRDGSGGIDFSEFQRAMELMGFQFSELQQLALFARYDESCTGEIDYNDFVEKVMESDFKAIHVSARKNLENMVASVFSSGENCSNDNTNLVTASMGEIDDSDDAEEWDDLMRLEVRRVFDLVDVDKSGYIERREIVVLLDKLGMSFSSGEIDLGFQRVDTDNSGLIDFDEFFTWYKTITTRRVLS